MRNISIVFLQVVIIIIGIVAIAIMIRVPMLEGRAEHLSLFNIYSDPFILYGYAASIAFFVALYKAIKLLSYIRQNRLFSQNSIKILRSIRYCAIVLSIMIVLAAIYIKIFHDKEDDPAGFLGMCMIITFIAIAIATAVAVLEKILQNAIDMKSENDLTV